MNGLTLAIKNNVVSRKKLIGIAKFVKINSEAAYLSQGSNILTTEQEIRDTKKAQVLIPLLTDTMNVADVLKQARDGGVQLTEAELNEFIVTLANEKITKPMIWRPRDGETISANQLFDRYQGSFEISSTVAKDKAFYASTFAQGVSGVPVAQGISGATKLLKSAVVERVSTVAETTAEDIKTNAILFANQLRKERAKLKQVKDKLTQQTFTNRDFVIVLNALEEVYLENDVRYNMYSEKVQTANGILSGNFDGSEVIVSKRDDENIAARVQLKGAATSIFMLRNKMNNDKVIGVDAYASSLEFDEGTGTWFPHLITFIVRDKTKTPIQDRVTFDDLILDMNLSKTESGNANNSEGLGASTKTNPAPPAPKQTKAQKDAAAKAIADAAAAKAIADAAATTTFDAATFKGDVLTIDGSQRAELKTLLKLPANAPNGDLQKLIDARK